MFSYTPVQGRVFPDGGDRLGVTAGLSDYNTVELPSCNLPQAFFLSVSVRRQTAAFSCCCHVLPLEDGQHFPHPRKCARTVELPEVLYQTQDLTDFPHSMPFPADR